MFIYPQYLISHLFSDSHVARDHKNPAQTSMTLRNRRRARNAAAAAGAPEPSSQVIPGANTGGTGDANDDTDDNDANTNNNKNKKKSKSKSNRIKTDGSQQSPAPRHKGAPILELPPLAIDRAAERLNLVHRAEAMHLRRAHTAKWERAVNEANARRLDLEKEGHSQAQIDREVVMPAPNDVVLSEEEKEAVLTSQPLVDLRARVQLMTDRDTVIVDQGLSTPLDSAAAGSQHGGVVSAEEFLQLSLCANEKGSKCSAARAQAAVMAGARRAEAATMQREIDAAATAAAAAAATAETKTVKVAVGAESSSDSEGVDKDEL